MVLDPNVNNKRVKKRFTTLEADFRKVHGDRYDYSKAIYIKTDKPLTIICKKHGEFTQRPNDHLRGKGCPECATERNLMSTEEYITRAKKVHGDRYDYSKLNYTKNKENVTIICPKHGDISIRADHHLEGRGCPKCAMNIPTNEEFIQKAKAIHADKYDYSKVDYSNNSTKVTIICKEHGEFLQTPNDHLSGYGCKLCAGNVKRTTQEFIDHAKEIHGERYDYSRVEYKNNREPVEIICQVHGVFRQTPTSHLQGSSCPKCANNIRTTTQYIEDAKKIHGDKYDYSKTVFEDSREKVIIICPEHGEFLQTASDHLEGKGCPECGAHGFVTTQPATLYYLSVNNNEAYKIGITNRSVDKRFYGEDKQKIRLIAKWEFENGADALAKETRIKREFAHVKYDGELLKDGNTELFAYDILGHDGGEVHPICQELSLI